MKNKIRQQILSNFKQVAFLEIINESKQHNKGLESHFKILLVTDEFNGISKINRHKTIYQILSNEIKQLHALSLHLFTTQEWQKKPTIPQIACQRAKG